MILTKWITCVGKAVIASKENECAVSCSSFMALSSFVKDNFNVKKHDAALLIKFAESDHVLILEDENDIPYKDLYDPGTGKLLIKYEVEQVMPSYLRIQ